MPQKSFNKQHFFFAVFLLFFSFALATPTLPQQQVVVKLILLITQVAPLTLEGNLNSNMAISKGVSKHHGNQEHGQLFGHYKMAGLQKLTFLKFLLLVTNTTIICITQTQAGIMNMALPGIMRNLLAVIKTIR